jgi:hypothetical protein
MLGYGDRNDLVAGQALRPFDKLRAGRAQDRPRHQIIANLLLDSALGWV